MNVISIFALFLYSSSSLKKLLNSGISSLQFFPHFIMRYNPKQGARLPYYAVSLLFVETDCGFSRIENNMVCAFSFGTFLQLLKYNCSYAFSLQSFLNGHISDLCFLRGIEMNPSHTKGLPLFAGHQVNALSFQLILLAPPRLVPTLPQNPPSEVVILLVFLFGSRLADFHVEIFDLGL